jgi:hypothetical protein
MLIEALPPVLVLHLKRFQYDAAAGGVIKIGKRVRFSSELEIPSGTPFVFDPGSRVLRILVIRSSQTLWYPMPVLNDPRNHRVTSCMEYSTITASLQAAGTIQLMFFARTETETQGRFGCTSMMKQ